MILDQPYDREDEHWQFEPGDAVECEQREFHHGRFLTATRKAESGQDAQ